LPEPPYQFLPLNSTVLLYFHVDIIIITIIIIIIINYRPISILNTFSKIFELIIYDHVSHSFKSKLNPCRHGFTKSKSTITNLLTCIEFITLLVSSQSQVDAIYFDLSSAFDLVSHTLLLQKLRAFGLYGG
jgi:hypothetical protein